MDEQFVRETFPQRLKHYMQIHGKKRTDLVRDLNFKYSTVSDWEKGITIPRMDKAEALARYFNITVADLVGEEKAPATVSPTEIGNLVRNKRESMGLTHEQLAQRTNISVKKLKQWETGKSTRPLGEAKTLSVALDIPFGKLMGVQVDTEQIQRQRFRERLYQEIPNLVLSDEEIAQVINYIKFVMSQRK